MLHLEASVHLEEVELVADEEALDRAGGGVADRAGELECVAAEPVGEADVHRRRGRLLDELLVPPLHGAVASAELDQIAVGVAEHLDLDVSRVLEVPLHVDRAVPEEPVARRRAPRRAPPPAPPRRTATRKPIPPPPPEALTATGYPTSPATSSAAVDALDGPAAAGDDGHAELGREPARARLLAHRLDRLRRGADEDDAPRPRSGGRTRRSRRGSRTRDGARRTPSSAARGQHRVDVEVALGGGRRPDRDRLVGETDVNGVPVGLRVDGDGRDLELAQGAENADRDLTPVRDEDLAEHGLGELEHRVVLGDRVADRDDDAGHRRPPSPPRRGSRASSTRGSRPRRRPPPHRPRRRVSSRHCR